MNQRPALDFLPEPLLQFGHGQCLENPKDGLFAFGPLAERKPSRMRIGIVGTPEGMARYRKWVQSITRYLPAADPEAAHQAAFPGFEAIFQTEWPSDPVVEIPISSSELSRLIRIGDRHLAIFETVSAFAEPIKQKLLDDDVVVDVWFLIVPEEIYRLGRPLSRVSAAERVDIPGRLNPRVAQRLLREPSLFPEEMKDAEVYRYDLNFHHQLKARLIEAKAVVQIVRDSSLNPAAIAYEPGARRLQDPATLAWNLCTTSFFKAGGRPWKLANVRKGVCYVGLVFKRNGSDPQDRNACCGAQMFLDSGDGLVFKGAIGPWYSAATKEFHLPRDEAKRLIELVVRSYIDIHQAAPTELFIHGRIRFSEDEWQGFRDGVPADTKVITVRIVRSSDFKLYGPGRIPVVRGTVYRVSPRRAFLWTSGFIPRLRTYPGREVPNPLLIDLCHGDADILTVLNDVMGLTKVNFNACIFADGLPVTLRFAEAVGEILTAAPQTEGPPLPFRHYI
jgi:hypothetical protein